MGRRERPVDPAGGPLPAFAHQLRELRKAAGSPSYRDLAKLAHFSDTSLSVAAGGTTLPSLEVTLAYVRACGGDVGEWAERWSFTASALVQPRPAQSGPAQSGPAQSGPAQPGPAQARQPPAREPSVPATPDSGPPVRPAQLPCAVTEFTGRAGQLDELDRLLGDQDRPAGLGPDRGHLRCARGGQVDAGRALGAPGRQPVSPTASFT